MELAKDKAIELINNFMGGVNMPPPIFGLTTSEAKQCALIAVDEILNSYNTKYLIYPKEVDFYNEVKTEINNL